MNKRDICQANLFTIPILKHLTLKAQQLFAVIWKVVQG